MTGKDGTELESEATTPAGERHSPMLQQYFAAKRQHPDALLFFRMGDFFELFFEDAKVAAKVLGIALTSRSKEQDVPMAGVPVRTVDAYLRRLIQAGHQVVVCDQVEDPKQAKGLVDRQITRIVTAGTILEEALLEGGRHNFLAALALDGECAVMAWLDVSTARFECASFPVARLQDELERAAPAELLLPASYREPWPKPFAFLDGAVRAKGAAGGPAAVGGGPAITFRPDHEFAGDVARRALCDHFRVADLGGFGIEREDAVVGPAGAVLAYARSTQRG